MSENEIDVSDIPPEILLAELYNQARPRGMGYMHERGDITPEQAAKMLSGEKTETDYNGISPVFNAKPGQPVYFDYLYGRPLKVWIDGKTLRTSLYDRDQGGPGTAQRIVDELRARLKATP